MVNNHSDIVKELQGKGFPEDVIKATADDIIRQGNIETPKNQNTEKTAEKVAESPISQEAEPKPAAKQTKEIADTQITNVDYSEVMDIKKRDVELPS